MLGTDRANAHEPHNYRIHLAARLSRPWQNALAAAAAESQADGAHGSRVESHTVGFRARPQLVRGRIVSCTERDHE